MRVLVSGGAGFIGSHVVDTLLERAPGTSVRVLDDLSTGVRANLAGRPVDFIEGTVTDAALVRDVTREVDAVVHLAAIGSVPLSLDDPVRAHEVNVDATVHILEAARAEGAQVVFASSSAVYGDNPASVMHETQWTSPLSPYAASKLSAESYVLAYGRSFGLTTLAFRFFNVYGPRQAADHPYAAVIPRFVDAALRGEALQVNGDGLQSRDFVHVRTVAETLSAAVLRRVGHPAPVNLARGTRITLLELADRLADVLERPLQVRHGPARPGDVRHSRADVERLRRLFPDIPDLPLEQGLASTVDWFRTRTG